MSARLTVAETAVAARRHPVTVRRALESGTLHGEQPVKGGRWTVLEPCIDAWLGGKPCAHRTNVRPMRRAS